MSCARPQTQTSDKRIVVVPQILPGPEFPQAFRVAAPYNHIVNFEHLAPLIYDFAHDLAPLPGTQAPAPAFADIILIAASVFIVHVADLHRLDVPVGNEGGAHSRSQPEKEHPADGD